MLIHTKLPYLLRQLKPVLQVTFLEIFLLKHFCKNHMNINVNKCLLRVLQMLKQLEVC